MSIAIREHPLRITAGALEVLKVVALLAMFADHVNTVLYAKAVPALFMVGRLAMPLFALVLAYNIARPGTDLKRLQTKLLWVGVLVHPLVVATINQGNWIPANILLTFAAAIAVLRQFDQGHFVRAIALATVCGMVVDYSIVGIALVLAGVLAFRRPSVGALVILAAVLLGLCAFNGNLVALLVLPVLAVAVAKPWEGLPRVRNLFWIVYPLHLGVLAIVARMWA